MTDIPRSGLSARAPLVAPHGVGWAIFALAVGGFAIGTGEFSMMGLLPSVAGNLHVSVPDAGKLISFYALGVVVGAPLITVLCARMPRRKLLMGMMGLYVIGNLLSAVSHDFAMIAFFRFFSGLPHGAYFGCAALVGASMVEMGKRAQAVGRVMLGLTTATLIGAPLAAWCGQMIDWHLAYAVVALIAAITIGLLAIFLPPIAAAEGASPLTELGALTRIQVWLALATAAVGFGGLFAVYSYIAPALINSTHMAPTLVPLVLVVLGLGMAVGNTIGATLADRNLRMAIIGFIVWDGVASLLFVWALPAWWAVTIDAFLIGFGVALAPALQTRLMDVAADAQALAASLNHSAFNIANGLGAAFAGAAITAGYGWSSPGWVGACLAMGGLAIFMVSLAIERIRPASVATTAGAPESAAA